MTAERGATGVSVLHIGTLNSPPLANAAIAETHEVAIIATVRRAGVAASTGVNLDFGALSHPQLLPEGRLEGVAASTVVIQDL